MCASIQNCNQALASSAKENAIIQLHKLLKDEMCGVLQTTNHCFPDNLAAARQDRVIARLEKMAPVRSELLRGHLITSQVGHSSQQRGSGGMRHS